MINILYRGLFILLILKLTMTLYQRRFNEVGGQKRMVSLYQSLILGVLYIVFSIVISKSLSPIIVYLSLLGTVFLCIVVRRTLFPYVTKCEKCQKHLGIQQILFIDSEICPVCTK